MILKPLLVAGLTAATALALLNLPSPGRPSSKLKRTIDSTDVSYRIERRAFEPDRPPEEPASRPEEVPRPEGNLISGESGLTPELVEQIRTGETQPEYDYIRDDAVLPEQPKPGDGKSGVYVTPTARQIWITGVKIRVVRQAKAILATVSGGLYNPGPDLSALSKKDAALIRSLIEEQEVNPRDLKGLVPFQYIDAESGRGFWWWRAADARQTYVRGEFQVDIHGNIVTEGEFKGRYVDKDGVFTKGDLKGWKPRANGYVAEGPYEGNTLNRRALVVAGPLKGWRLKPDGTILKPLNNRDPDFSGSIISPTGRMETGPAEHYKLSPPGVVLDGHYEWESMNSKGFFTTGKVKGFKLEPEWGTVISPDNFKSLQLDKNAEIDEDGKYELLDGFRVKSDGSTRGNGLGPGGLRGIPLVLDGDTLAFTGTLDGFKLTDPKTISENLPLESLSGKYFYFTRQGTLSNWVLRSDGKVWKMGTKSAWISLESPDSMSLSAGTGKIDMSRDRFDYSAVDRNEQEWNAGIDEIAAALKENPPSRPPPAPPSSDDTKLKRGNSVLTQVSVNPGTMSTQSNNGSTRSQIEQYIAFYTACQANVTALIWPTLLSLLASPSAAQLPLLQLAAASIYVDLTRSNILISGPFWQGMYDFSNFTMDLMAANVSQTEITAMNSTNNQVASKYLQAWGNATRLLNATTLEKDMDLVAPYLNPNDTSLLPQDWTAETPWDPNMNAFFPNTTMS